MSGKKSSGEHYTSKGERRADRSITNAVRRDRRYLDVIIAKHSAWQKGRDVWLTIDNPNPNETNKKKIRVKAKDIWGKPGNQQYHMKLASGD